MFLGKHVTELRDGSAFVFFKGGGVLSEAALSQVQPGPLLFVLGNHCRRTKRQFVQWGQ
jgi:hypothetical protein